MAWRGGMRHIRRCRGQERRRRLPRPLSIASCVSSAQHQTLPADATPPGHVRQERPGAAVLAWPDLSRVDHPGPRRPEPSLGSFSMSQAPGVTGRADLSQARYSSPLPAQVDELWERRGELGTRDLTARSIVVSAVDALDSGAARVAFVDPATGGVVVDERAKRAILLSFRLLPMERSQAGDFHYHDRIALKTRLTGVRVVPGAVARWGAYIAPGTVLMPSFVNIGAYVDEGTLVDTWATVGSAAQIGKNVHLSGGVGIGGVLEPPNAVPVVVEDDAFVGSRCMVVDGARVRTGAKLGSGTNLGATTHVIDVQTGEELPRGGHARQEIRRRGIRYAVRACAQAAARREHARQADAERDPA